MKKIDILALSLYALGLVYLLDWFLFVGNNDPLADDFVALKAKYVARFPEALQPMVENDPQPAAILFVLVFGFCGFLFVRKEHVGFRILGVTAFLLAFWNWFSIM